MDQYLGVLKKYAEFDERARRKEFWMFALFNILITIVLNIIDSVVVMGITGGIPVLGLLYGLAVLVPNIAVAVRRLHDTNRSGWFILLGLIPCVGLILIVFFIEDGTKGSNKFGSDPKGGERVADELTS